MRLADIKAVKLLNSLARPTVAVRVKTENSEAWGSAPAGTSKSKFEAREFFQSTDLSVELFNNYARRLSGIDFQGFSDLEKTEKIINVETVGSSATIALEFALLNALAAEKKRPLWRILNPTARKFPRILANVIGGGQHASGSTDLQEILISPQTKKISDAVFAASAIYGQLKQAIQGRDKHFMGGRTAEGAWTTSLPDETVLNIVDKTSGKYSKLKIELGIDIAASGMFIGNKYLWRNFSAKQKGLHLNEIKQIQLVEEIANRFNLAYIEDPLHQEAYRGFADLSRRINKYAKRLVCGDDLIATNLPRLKIAVKQKAVNAVIIKPNQVGSLVKARMAVDFAKKNGIACVLSHRSGDTTDTTMSHLAFAWQVPFVKFGLAGGERIAKLNELIKIEQGF